MSNWQSLTFGVEIECITRADRDEVAGWLAAVGIRCATYSSANHSDVRTWKVVPDGSVSGGLEVVSPVLKGREGLAELRKVMNALQSNGAKVDRQCGLHVHVGARGATARQLANVAKMFLRHEANFDRIVSASRRGSANRFCRSNKRSAVPGMMTSLDSAASIDNVARVANGGYQSGYCDYRYHKLNYCSYLTHGTIEFRQHQGTVDADKACHWVRLLTGFVAVAFSAPGVVSTEAASFEQLMRMTDSVGEAFFAARRDQFDAG